MRWTVLLGICGSCSGGGGPQAVADVGGAGPQTPDEPCPRAAHDEAVRALIVEVRPMVARCRALTIDAVSPAQAAEAPLSWSDEAFDGACGDLGALWARTTSLIGGSRGADLLIEHLARAADDLDYLRRSRRAVGRERRNAIEHVVEAMGELTEDLSAWPGGDACPYQAQYGAGHEASWRRDLEIDGRTVPESRRSLQYYALQQGTDPVNVRARMLRTFVAVSRADLEARREGVARGPDAEARGRYLAGLAGWRDAYARITERYATGQVTSYALIDQAVAEADAAFAGWQAAWEAETRR